MYIYCLNHKFEFFSILIATLDFNFQSMKQFMFHSMFSNIAFIVLKNNLYIFTSTNILFQIIFKFD